MVSSNCLSCAAGYYLKKAYTCELCTGGTGKEPDANYASTVDPYGQTCIPDASLTGCNTYRTHYTCLGCKVGYYLSSSYQCTFCSDGKGKAVDSVLPTRFDQFGHTCNVVSSGPETSESCIKSEALKPTGRAASMPTLALLELVASMFLILRV